MPRGYRYKRWKLKRHDREQTFDPSFKPETLPAPKLKSPQKVERKSYRWDPELGWVRTDQAK